MAKTTPEDIIMEAVQARYTALRSPAINPWITAGIVATGPVWDEYASRGGKTVSLPYWNELSGDREVLSADAELTVNHIAAGEDVACIHNDGKAWGVNDLASWLSGDDPVKGIRDGMQTFWSQADPRMYVSTLTGVFATAGMAEHVKDLTLGAEEPADATRLNAISFIDATALMGDRSDRLEYVVMRSEVEAELRKKDQIAFIPASNGKVMLRFYQGRQVIICDGLPIDEVEGQAKIFTTYLLGRGVIVQGHADLSGRPVLGGFGTEAFELSRAALASDTNLTNRRRIISHFRGVKWLGVNVAKKSPSNEEMKMAANYSRVYPINEIAAICVRHHL